MTSAGTITFAFSIGELADLAGVTVRTLHHYDRVGLLRPGHRNAAGYRCYTGPDADRLAQILGYRELGFALDEIRSILDDPDSGAQEHLHRQRRLLTERIDRLRRIVSAIDTTLEARTMQTTGLSPAEKLAVFGDFDPDDYAEEAEQRWGTTDAYQQSAARTKSYTKQDWQTITAEGSAIRNALAQALAAGLPATSVEAMDAAEQARQHITRWFYDCPLEMHRNLGDMYVADERFTATYEKVAAGLAAYVREAIHANADRAAT
ncbi:MAG: MerR family transcriptional regulator [Actinomycetota bacterium]|nr:MerR family transcriptional regulator [Actinomycetota bacterium]